MHLIPIFRPVLNLAPQLQIEAAVSSPMMPQSAQRNWRVPSGIALLRTRPRQTLQQWFVMSQPFRVARGWVCGVLKRGDLA